MEMDEVIKTDTISAMECNMKLTAFKKSKSVLQKEMVEIGSPLIHVSHWTASYGSPRGTVEFIASHEKLGRLFDQL